MRPSWSVVVTTFVSSVAACAGEPTNGNGVTDATEWTVSPDPLIEIGGTGGAPYDFSQIVGVAMLSDRRLVVADRGNHAVRVFNGSGEWLGEFGGEGEGPGEFRFPTEIAVSDDSILVVEGMFGAARLHVFDADGGFQRTARLASDMPAGVAPMAVLSPKTLVVSRGAGPREATPPPVGEVVRDSVTLGILRMGPPQTVSWIGSTPNQSYFSYPMPAGLPVTRGIGQYRLGPSLVLGASSTDVWIGDSGAGTITIFDASGSLRTEVQFPVPPRPFDEAALSEARRAELAAVPESDRFGRRARIEVLYSSSTTPPTAPRFTRFVAGPDGEMWIELFVEVPGAERGAVVLDREGRAIGRATIPSGVVLHDVTRDRVIGVRRDSLDVERVVVHRLVR